MPRETFILIVVIWACVVVLLFCLLGIMLVKKRRAGKESQQEAYRRREDDLDQALANPLKQRGMRNPAAMPVTGMAKELRLSYCVNGRNLGYQCLPGERVIVGRNTQGNQVVIPDATVSGRHCEIYSSGNRFYVRDLQARNKTLVWQGSRWFGVDASGVLLENGNRIRAGNVDLLVQILEG